MHMAANADGGRTMVINMKPIADKGRNFRTERLMERALELKAKHQGDYATYRVAGPIHRVTKVTR
jgi:hypothetical protein